MNPGIDRSHSFPKRWIPGFLALILGFVTSAMAQAGGTPSPSIQYAEVISAAFDHLGKITPAITWAAEQAAERMAVSSSSVVNGRLSEGGRLLVSYMPEAPASSNSFAEEARTRAGGMTMVNYARPGSRMGPRDVLLIDDLGLDTEQRKNHMREARKAGALVILFGSASSQLSSEADISIDTGLPPGTAPAVHFDGLPGAICPAAPTANIAALWIFTGELVAACTRLGKMPAMFLSVLAPGGWDWFNSYKSQYFHTDITVDPVPSGQLGSAYLTEMRRCLQGLRDQATALQAAGEMLAAALEAGGTARVVAIGSHHLPGQFGLSGDPGRLDASSTWPTQLEEMAPGDALLFIGYFDLPPWSDLESFREAGFPSIWVTGGREVASLNPQPREWEIHIDPFWTFGDYCVEVPGYPIGILPPSGVIQTAALWMITGEVERAMLPAPTADEDLGYPPGTLTPNIDLGLQEVPVDVPAKYRDMVAEGLTVNLPPGFSARIFAAGLRGPRDMEVSPDGVLHVALPGTGQIVALPDRDGDGVADEHIVVLDNLRVSDSVVFYKGDMYVGERHQVIRASDADGDGIYEDREVFIADLPWEAWHSSKTIIFDEPNEKLYVGVGSPCDLCRMEPGYQFNGASTTETVPYRPERGTVLQFNADGTGQRIFATGVRNVVGMDLHPLTNELWGTNNGHDEEGRSRPPEWIDVLQDGDFQGYPFVHSHLVWNDFTIDRYHPMLPITREDTLLAMTQKKPVALVPAHWAPMRIHFYTGSQFPEMYRNAAFVAFHAGRAKLSSHPGYKVQALFSDPDGSNARMADFITGFQTGTTTSSVWGFPHGVTSDAEGSLYVSSDRRNEVILKITHSLLHGSWEHDLPRSVLLATPVNLRATVRLERGNENGGDLRVTADLSAFGGPANLALTAVGDGEYTLDTQFVAETVGAHSVTVKIEQESGERTEVLQFAGTVDVLPPPWRHDLPSGLTFGKGADLEATVHIESLSPAGGGPRVTADLTALGGPAEVELASGGGDDYILRVHLELDVPSRTHEVWIRFEQEVGGVVYAHDFLHHVIVSPPDLHIIDDVLSEGWKLSGEHGAQVVGTTSAGPVYNGREALAVRVQPENFYTMWSMEWQPPSTLDPFGFAGIRFAIHTAEATAPTPSALALFIGDLSVELLRAPFDVVVGDPEWQVVEVSFEHFVVTNYYSGQEDQRVEEISSIRLQGNLTGALYIDDVRLVTRIPSAPPVVPTAVLETTDKKTPNEFALGPSYPNPFNAETLIRLSLPEAAPVRLSVYNLAGQRVVDLVSGRLEAGTQLVRWNGRDGSGAELATGVYVIRLSAGRWIAAGKVLLLR